MSYISTGLKSYDEIIGKLCPGKVYAVCSRPMIGKTSFCLSLCGHISFIEKIPTAFFSLECSFRSVLKRLTLMQYNGLQELIHPVVWKPSAESLSQGYPYLVTVGETPFLFIDDDPLPEKTIIEKITKLVNGYGVRVIIIDYMELLVNRQNRETMLANFKYLAENLNIVIVVSSMLYRYSLNQDDKNPVFCKRHNIIHPELIRICDYVTVIHRPDFYQRPRSEPQAGHTTELHVLRHSYGNHIYTNAYFSIERWKFEE